MWNSADSLRRLWRLLHSGDAEGWEKLFAFIGVWGGAIIVALSRITVSSVHVPPLWERPGYDLVRGYSKSLILLVVPLLALAFWYYLEQKNDKDGSFRTLMWAVVCNAALTGLVLIVFDVLFAPLLFSFPDRHAVWGWYFYGYKWRDDCSTLWRMYRLSCYEKSIPYEEALFYLGGAAVLRGMYLWASEDFLALYSLPFDKYVREAKLVKRLVTFNWLGALIVAAIVAAGLLLKDRRGGGYPVYLLLQLLILSPPVVFLYTRVKPFINTRALLMVMVLQVLVSVIWEAVAALPYGWWSYNDAVMIGFVQPWSHLPVEACFFWIVVGWSAVFAHEATKIKVRSGRSWFSILFGDNRLEPAVTAS